MDHSLFMELPDMIHLLDPAIAFLSICHFRAYAMTLYVRTYTCTFSLLP